MDLSPLYVSSSPYASLLRVVFGPGWSVGRPKGPAVLPARVGGPGGCHHHPVRPNGPTVPRTAREARGIVGPLGRHMSWSALPGPLGRAGRTAGPLGRQTPAAPPRAPQPTPVGVADGSRGSSEATTPGNGPQHRLHPEGGAKNRGSTGPARTTITDPPRTSVCGRVREVTRDKLDPAGGLALCRVSGVSAPHLGAHDPNTGRNPSWLRAYGPVPFYIPTTTNSSRPRDRQTRRFVATAQLTPRAVSHSDPRPHNP